MDPVRGEWQAAFDSSSITHSTLKSSIELMIRRALLNGDMRAGEIFSANKLARQLGISNSPAREAMMELVNKGLLELVRNRGFRVVQLSDRDKREVYELRLQVEVEAVRRVAASGVSQSQARELQRLADETSELAHPETIGDYLEADQRFHIAIVNLLGNRRWTGIVENLRDQSRVNGHYDFLSTDEHLSEATEQHRRIAQAVSDGESDLAAALMVQHLEYARPRSS
ncbi:GntR family transcriptional regulator [Nesterenkonia natronophila]|uniref:GntR family transcriptional regulator n=1 Tax=Nesterenkonia natronophila TaxID=2174932 RepID=A0A3A4F922_9MICC|nr:GntR family transcriptional regulator [Nesterenkonia natronophila]RJN32980.1 GntR family transcriptional regulator [Nesterenkonia natronophila]